MHGPIHIKFTLKFLSLNCAGLWIIYVLYYHVFYICTKLMEHSLYCDVCTEMLFNFTGFLLRVCSENAGSSLDTRYSMILVQKFNLNFTCFFITIRSEHTWRSWDTRYNVVFVQKFYLIFLSTTVQYYGCGYLCFKHSDANQSFICSPTDVLASYLKKENKIKIYIKMYIKTVLTCFGVTVTPSSGSALICAY